jgi:phosphotriesterase-related protein
MTNESRSAGTLRPAPAGEAAFLETRVETVTGAVRAGDLGMCLVGEAVLARRRADEAGWPAPLYPELREAPVTLDALGRLRRDVHSSLDAWDLSDPALAIAELAAFRAAGGGAVVVLLGPDATGTRAALADVATKSGVRILASTPAPRRPASADDWRGLAADWVARLRGTDADAGGALVGPVDAEPTDAARKLRAALVAAADAGVPAIVGVEASTPAADALLDALAVTGVPARRAIAIVEVDPRPETIRAGAAAGGAYGGVSYEDVLPPGVMRLAQAGVYLAFAHFGWEPYDDRTGTTQPRDPERIAAIGQLIAAGHLRQILLGHGIRHKTQLRAYGGWGYEHIPRHVVPMLERAGLAPKEVTSMLIWNPARALSAAAVAAPGTA